MLASISPAQSGVFKAGVAKVDIAPSPGKYMLGSGEALAEGVHDTLYARVLVLEAGEKRLALVSLDLCRVFQAPLVRDLRNQVRRSSGISYVFIAATHTHSAPIIPIDDEYPLTGMVAWQSEAVSKIAKAIYEAHQKATEARLGTGYGIAYIGHNRRQVNPDGTVTMLWKNPTRIPTAPVDPTVAILRVDAANGSPLAILVNYACHPVVVMGNLKKYSADFPGVMCETVERAFEDKPLCIFLQGAAGDIDTYYTNVPPEEDPVKALRWTGESLGQEVIRVAKSIRTEAVSDPSLDFAEDLLTFRFRWNREKYLEAFRREFSKQPKLFDFYLPQLKQEQQLPVATVLINKHIAMVGVPGEAFVEFQMDWRARCPVRDCFFLGYANGFFGYLPTILAATEGGHGANDIWARIEPGAGERMVDHAIARVYQMLGRLRDAPETHR